MPDLLLELFSEEIPARMQRKAADDLRKLVTNALVDAGLTYEGGKEYWTPRRLTLDLRGLTARSADIRQERKGPRTDAPQKAIDGFLRGAGLSRIEEAQIQNDPKKGEFYVAVIEKSGRDATEIIADIMPGVINNFPWPKSMRWGQGSAGSNSLSWVRPLQSILCTFGAEAQEPEVVRFTIGDATASNVTAGHRFMGGNDKKFPVKRFEDYSSKLKNEKVILDAEQRKQMILADAQNLAFAQGYELVQDNQLLDEVANLVEWPTVLMGTFDEDFLDIPPQVIQLTIRENQKCFVLKNQQDGKLVNRFLLVSNIIPVDGGAEVARGNGKVVNARLADAKFFWDSDLAQVTSEKGFDLWIKKLDSVTFHAKLGTLGARVKRIATLLETIAPLVKADPQNSNRAALLCKADLNSAMVFEFPELQGQMGRFYAERAGETDAVSAAIEDHYKPLGPTDDVPTDPVSVAVALADKLDVLVGFWAIDEKPTGSKDPFALRRAALGVIRLILENEVRLPILSIANTHAMQLALVKSEGTFENLLSFFHDRLKVYLRDQNIRHDLIDAVITNQSDDLLVVSQRARALQKLVVSPEGTDLLAGYKRAANILSAAEKKGADFLNGVDGKFLTEEAEVKLNDKLDKIDLEINEALAKEDYSSAMKIMAELRQPVDDFFDNVLVNDEDEAVKNNRLALLNRIRIVTGKIADFSKIGK